MATPRWRILTARPSWICIQCRANSSVASRISPPPQALRTGKNKNALLNVPARTRFAPSPTGYLHLGSLRTALFNYLVAKKTGGQFLLRLEDTDQKRTIPGAEERLYEDLRWAGLNWDEGPNVGGRYGPYRQSERTALYRKHADSLISSGHAYRCFCSAERLDTLARHRNQQGLPLGYDRKCASIRPEEAEDRAAGGEAHVVRLKTDGYPMFHDLVYGKTGQNRSGGKKQLEFIDRVYEDPILLKSDGYPTYHLANVVDDHEMKITHVIRGHKRNADIDISLFKDRGIMPSALLNFAALLGWSHTSKSDVLTLKEMEEMFNLKITKGNTVVAFEKMWFLQKAHAQRCASERGPEIQELEDKSSVVAEEILAAEHQSTERPVRDIVTLLLQADAKSYTSPEEFINRNKTFFIAPSDRPAYEPTTKNASSATVSLSALHTAAAALTLTPESHWDIETHRLNIKSYNFAGSLNASDSPSDTDTAAANPIAQDKAFKKELYHYLRWALSAGAPGPGIPETLTILGRAESVRRLQGARELTTPVVQNTCRVPKTPIKLTRATVNVSGMEKNADNSWMGSLAPK
ncbi:glutamyl-tRNA synthetase [Talaromyces proteolyticus]|uniref:Glutamyl-tRNA synthetase n=1 Tax=Talaromyces proteolyticus TaxID=1131652 RepID=A0AAD4KQ49_9EURO|nr:glutamyl-tRNA synthetase [Talaromyces proteolyticus]KAH8696685.1 glutamyl-tRNA synthetase [Talaromyces proteolyticus]